jgi:hypothetical protein
MAATFISERVLWLSLYFFSNLTLTLYNKLVLIQFPFPYSLTAIHALCGAVGGLVLMERGIYEPRRTDPRQNVILVMFGMLYALNIAVSNASLGLVTVPVGLVSSLMIILPIVQAGPSSHPCSHSDFRHGHFQGVISRSLQ